MDRQYRVIHLLNQFFAGLGGEEQADLAPVLYEGAMGPGKLMKDLWPGCSILATIVVGDNYVSTRSEEAVSVIMQLLHGKFDQETDDMEPQLLLAGPAFNAGRYAMGCGITCGAIQKEFGIPAVTAMYEENPAVDQFRKELIIVRTGPDVMSMREALSRMGSAAKKILEEKQLLPEQDNIFPQGRRKNYFSTKTGAERAVEMLLAKLAGRPFETEYRMPVFDHVTPALPVTDLRKAKIALVTSGGIVPKGNPDRIEAASASRFGCYPLDGVDSFDSRYYQTAHGGYDPTFANEDPNRVLPLDAVRHLEQEGAFGSLYETYFATVGNGTSVERARSYGRDIAQKLLADGVQAVILTST